jgi:hypothetical protein
VSRPKSLFPQLAQRLAPMGKIYTPKPVKLIFGFIFKDGVIFEKAKVIIKKKFGKIDFESQNLKFDLTDYYAEEIGQDLSRKFISLKKLVPADKLPALKVLANKLEDKFSKNLRRRINIDPGYVDLAKLVLASTKDYQHRIYLKDGIFAEITLFYQDKSFRPGQWTYLDYKTPEHIAVFNQIRQLYYEQSQNRD